MPTRRALFALAGAAGWASARPATAMRRRLLALDAQSLSVADVREVLVGMPAPRLILLHGSLPLLTMAPFAEFLIDMGYPEAALRHPADGRLSLGSFGDSRELAGSLAWHYETEGLMPMLLGHSQGGMRVIAVLHELASSPGAAPLPMWDPVQGRSTGRATLVDPIDGSTRSVASLQLPYAAALATGRTMRVLLGQWDMLARLRSVPDSVQEFSGYFLPWDVIAGSGPDAAHTDPYRATGRATVRNLMLPAGDAHLTLPLAKHLSQQPATRAWIEAYDPRTLPPEPPDLAGADLRNIVHAADIWYSLKKHWCLQAQRLAAARLQAAPTRCDRCSSAS